MLCMAQRKESIQTALNDINWRWLRNKNTEYKGWIVTSKAHEGFKLWDIDMQMFTHNNACWASIYISLFSSGLNIGTEMEWLNILC